MKAIVADRYGPPEIFRLVDIPPPSPGPGEILVRVHAAAATPPDCAFRTGKPLVVRLFSGLRRPRSPILGDLMAGEVVALGAGVNEFRVGDRVFGSPAPPTGAYAQYRSVRADAAIAPMPRGVDFIEATAIADGGMTALPFLRDHAKLRPGQHILINGAAGAIGSAAVQIAKHFGATVTGVCGSNNIEFVRSLGADHIIDYSAEDFTVRRGLYDVIFDVVAKKSFKACRRALKPTGIYMTTVPTLASMVALVRRTRSVGKRSIFAATGLRKTVERTGDLALLRELTESGKLRGVAGRIFPLEEVAAAHRLVETGHKRGSAIIAIGQAAASRGAAAWQETKLAASP